MTAPVMAQSSRVGTTVEDDATSTGVPMQMGAARRFLHLGGGPNRGKSQDLGGTPFAIQLSYVTSNSMSAPQMQTYYRTLMLLGRTTTHKNRIYKATP